jgi:shikimate dehydrogenase/3-dehydroquinate dehydratase type I
MHIVMRPSSRTPCLSLAVILGLIPLSVALLGRCSSTLPGETFKARPFLQATANGETQTAKITERNMFYDYDKPIVLLGFSSKENNELHKLADFLHSDVLKGGKIIPLFLGEMNAAVTAESIVSQYRWPDIVVLDYNQDNPSELPQSLYESELLTVHINVDPASSGMDEESAARKNRLDQSVFVSFSDYELCIRDEGADNSSDNWKHIEWELVRLLARARLIPAIPGDKTRTANSAHLTMGDNTFFLSLSFPDISQTEPYVQDMCQDVDAMEYRADLLKGRASRFDLLYGMQLLRRYCRPHVTRGPALPFGRTIVEDNMPIVYTVRTANQAGTYSDDRAGISKMFEMLEWGLRGGVEVLDVESAWDYIKTRDLLDKAESRYSSQILGSHHVVGQQVTTEEAVNLFQQCSLSGRAHGAKVVLTIDNEEKDRMAYEAALIASELAATDGGPQIPKVSLILGDVGQFSRVINLPFTPVTHETLPFKAAPGQLTASEIMTTRLLTKIFQPKKFAILGHNIAYSVSPQMQGAAFAATKLPHEFIRIDVPTVEEFISSVFFKSDDFGGLSVTIPHKQAIMPYIDVLSDAARDIGSVNTVIARVEFIDDDFKRVIYGDNTDWRGIYNPLDRLLAGSVDESSNYALILGAGGTARAAAYVARKLGFERIYYNRSPLKAMELALAFGGTVVTSLGMESIAEGVSLGDALKGTSIARLRVVISTLPAAVNFVLPEWIFTRDKRLPIVFDVNYKPYTTELVRQAEVAGCSVLRGSEMLWEQGVGQFELWTERSAPYRIMKQVVLQNCREKPAPS